MAIVNVTEWSATAANNTELNGISIANNAMLVSNIDNVVRELMAQIKAGIALLAQANTFTATQRISANFARLNIADTSLTAGSRAIGIGMVADGTAVIFALNDDFTFKEDLARFEPEGATVTDPQTVMTREKGDARYGRINTKTSATETAFDVGQHLLCIMDSTPGAIPALNSTQTVRLDNGRYKVAGSTGTALTGTWRVCGVLTTGEANVGVQMQRVS